MNFLLSSKTNKLKSTEILIPTYAEYCLCNAESPKKVYKKSSIKEVRECFVSLSPY